MKILFVTRDKKPGMIATRLARVLQAQGTDIRVVAEGMSVAEWKSAGFENRIVSEGPLDIKAPWDINAYYTIKNINPDVLVTGLSSPIRMEEHFVREMTETGLARPIVVLDDNWGAIYRCKHPVDLVLTIDELGKRLVSQNSAYAHHDYQIEIIGDLSATAASEPVPQATIDAFNAAKGDVEYAFILASQKWPESDDIMTIALGSCARSLDAGAKLVVIPRFHPGAKPEDQTKWRDQVGLLIREYPDAVVNIDAAHSTDHLATLADGVFAATGSALRAAAYAGKFPICVWTPRLGEKIKTESGMEHHPLVVGKAAFELSMSDDIITLIKERGNEVCAGQKALLAPVPFDAVKAADAILGIAKR